MLCGIEQRPVKFHRLAVRAVRLIGRSIPEDVILRGVCEIPGISDPEGIAAFEIIDFADGIGEDDAVVCNFGKIFADCIFQYSCHAILRSGDREGETAGLFVVISLRVTEIPLLI